MFFEIFSLLLNLRIVYLDLHLINNIKLISKSGIEAFKYYKINRYASNILLLKFFYKIGISKYDFIDINNEYYIDIFKMVAEYLFNFSNFDKQKFITIIEHCKLDPFHPIKNNNKLNFFKLVQFNKILKSNLNLNAIINLASKPKKTIIID